MTPETVADAPAAVITSIPASDALLAAMWIVLAILAVVAIMVDANNTHID